MLAEMKVVYAHAPDGQRVADFSTHFSGPVCRRQMVQFGADVIKIGLAALMRAPRTPPPASAN